MTAEESIPGPLARLLTGDHMRIDTWLNSATERPGEIDALAYTSFRSDLLRHIAFEESLGGVYDLCETLTHPDVGDLLEALRHAPEVPVSAHVDGPQVMGSVQRALERAGYQLED